jgi:uncharacterized protein (DUF488 family)
MAQRTLFTIGHSTHPWREFVELLKAWKIAELVDVRTVPRSRAVPWFSKDKMGAALRREGIKYVHVAALGGLRHAKKDSSNDGWRNASFRGYADYMQTEAFAAGLDRLNRLRRGRRVCVMCSEAVWWRCHRRMIADAEAAAGVPVRHIMSRSSAKPHELTEFARVEKKRGKRAVVRYPGEGKAAFDKTLFEPDFDELR